MTDQLGGGNKPINTIELKMYDPMDRSYDLAEKVKTDLRELIVFRKHESSRREKQEANRHLQWLDLAFDNRYPERVIARHHSHIQADDFEYRKNKIREILEDPNYPNGSVQVDGDFIKNHLFLDFAAGQEISGVPYFHVAILEKPGRSCLKEESRKADSSREEEEYGEENALGAESRLEFCNDSNADGKNKRNLTELFWALRIKILRSCSIKKLAKKSLIFGVVFALVFSIYHYNSVSFHKDNVDRLIDYLKNGSSIQREDAAYFLQFRDDPKSILPLVRATKDENKKVAETSVRALSRFGKNTARAGLVSAYRSKSVTIDGFINNLGGLNYNSSGGIIEAVFSDQDQGLNDLTQQLEQYAPADHPDTVDALMEALGDSHSDKNQKMVLSLLAESKSLRAADSLLQYMGNNKEMDLPMRLEVIKTLKEVCDNRSLKALYEFWRTESRFLVAAEFEYMEIICSLDSPENVREFLVSYIDSLDTDNRVKRGVAFVYLTDRYNDPSLSSFFERFIEDKDSLIARYAREALAEYEGAPVSGVLQ